jgi:hypothetical protein
LPVDLLEAQAHPFTFLTCGEARCCCESKHTSPRSGVDDDGDDWGPAPAGTEDPVGHDAFAHQITLLHIASCRTFGVPRIYAELRRPGRWVNRKRITRVMRECDI